MAGDAESVGISRKSFRLALLFILLTLGAVLIAVLAFRFLVPTATLRAISPDGKEVWRHSVRYPKDGLVLTDNDLLVVGTRSKLLAFGTDGSRAGPPPHQTWAQVYRDAKNSGRDRGWISLNLPAKAGRQDSPGGWKATNPYTGWDIEIGGDSVAVRNGDELQWSYDLPADVDPYQATLSSAGAMLLEANCGESGQLVCLDCGGRETGRLDPYEGAYARALLPDGSFICDFANEGYIAKFSQDCRELWRVAVPPFVCSCHTQYSIEVSPDGYVYYFGQFAGER